MAPPLSVPSSRGFSMQWSQFVTAATIPCLHPRGPKFFWSHLTWVVRWLCFSLQRTGNDEAIVDFPSGPAEGAASGSSAAAGWRPSRSAPTRSHRPSLPSLQRVTSLRWWPIHVIIHVRNIGVTRCRCFIVDGGRCLGCFSDCFISCEADRGGSDCRVTASRNMSGRFIVFHWFTFMFQFRVPYLHKQNTCIRDFSPVLGVEIKRASFFW